MKKRRNYTHAISNKLKENHCKNGFLIVSYRYIEYGGVQMNNNMEKEIFNIYIEDIIPNRFQPRLVFDDAALNELADSIKKHGIIQPLVVRKVEDKYEIIAGERRYKAAQIAGLQRVPVVVMNLDDKESAEVAVIENTQREDLSALEEAESYKKLLDKGYLTQDQLASRMGKSQPAIANKLRLLSLDEEVKDALLNGKISERHARSLLSLKNSFQQKEVLNKIIDSRLTVKQTDELIKTFVNEPVETLSFDNPINKVSPVVEEPTPEIEKIPPLPEAPHTFHEIPTAIDNTQPVIEEPTTPKFPPLFDDIPIPLEIPKPVVDNPIPEEQPLPFIKPAPIIMPPEPPIRTPEVETIQPVPEALEPIPGSRAATMVDDQINIAPISNVDINKMKETAMDINPVDQPADVAALLGINNTPEDLPPPNIEPAGPRFIIPLEDEEVNMDIKPVENIPLQPDNTITTPFGQQLVPEPEPKTYTDSLVQEFRQSNIPEKPVEEALSKDIKTAIDKIKETITILEKSEFKIVVEEFDFENLYQIIIKINK